MKQIEREMLKLMPDGTEKQINPFTGTEVWCIPERKNRPIFTAEDEKAEKINHRFPEDYCNFCAGRILYTPPEKSRLLLQDGRYVIKEGLLHGDWDKQTAEFRRIPNLFEIVTINYWKQNYQYRLSDKNRWRKEQYISSAAGREHALAVVDLKLRYLRVPEERISSMSIDKKLDMVDAFFGGGHELIIPRRHYVDGAEYNNQLASSGELSAEEHYQYFKFTIDAMLDLYENNRYIRYISIYQNWLKAAGASFQHLHKQLVALDEWGVSVEREMEMANTNHNMYNEYAANFAAYNNLVLCENDYAIAFADIGHRHPTVAIYSKSTHCRPSAHRPDEVRGFSDIVHGIHAATGPSVSCNEEWYYMPRDCVTPMPWHVLVKWRINIAAGFEGGTKIYVNPISLTELRDQLVPRLFDLRAQGKIAYFNIAEECVLKPNSLQYYKNGLE